MAEPLNPLRVATVATYDHLHHTIALVRSLDAVWAGGLDVHVALIDHVDRPRPGLDERGDVTVHTMATLGLPRPGWLATKFGPADLCCVVKPHLVHRVLADAAAPVLYADSDVVFYADPGGLVSHRPGAPMVVTPHLTEPNRAGTEHWPSMGEIASAGMLNAGVFVARPGAATERFLGWWGQLCLEPGAFVADRGRQTEQQSFNWVTSFVPDVAIHTDRGVNVAYWNLQERPIRWAALDGGDAGTVLLDGAPITCFHFSGYAPGGERLSDHGGQVPLAASPTAHALCADYDRRLVDAGMAGYAVAGYEFASCDGVTIPRRVREELRRVETRLDIGAGPFEEVAPGALRQLQRVLAPDLAVPSYVLPSIHGRRDVFDAVVPPRRIYAGALLRWLDDGFLRQHEEGRTFDRFAAWLVDRRVVDELSSRLAAALGIDPDEAGELVRHDRAGALDRLEAAGPASDPDLVLALVGARYRVADVEPITSLRLLYDDRPDLQAAFPDPLGTDLADFRRWLAEELGRQYECGEAVAAVAAHLPLERALGAVLGFLARDDALLERARTEGLTHELVLTASYAAAVEVGITPSDVLLVEWWSEGRSDDERAAVLDPALAPSLDGPAGDRWLARWRDRHAPEIPRSAVRSHVDQLQALARAVPRLGVNLFGYHRSPIGLGTMSRGLARALEAAAVEVRPQVLLNQTMAADFDVADLDPDYAFDLPTDVVVSYPHIGHDPLARFPVACRGRTRVAYLAWEQRDVHPRWARTHAGFDELWALSSFAAEALGSGLGRPCHAVPCVVEVRPDAEVGREQFGLPLDAFVVGLVVDATSSLVRKNPIGAARAVAAAFGGRSDVVVVLKVNRGDHPLHAPAVAEVLAVLAAARLDVRLITDVLPPGRLHALVRCFDLVLSLHRAEGFGYNLAEAMLLGVPVVATGYSGNLDFMHPGNSLLVPAREVVAQRGEGPFVPGSVWAEPDLDAAADACRSVLDDRSAALARAEVARRDVAVGHSAEAVGARVRGLLEALA